MTRLRKRSAFRPRVIQPPSPHDTRGPTPERIRHAQGFVERGNPGRGRTGVDAMLRERRLAAMRAEIEQSLDAPPPELQPGRGYDPNQLLLGSNPDADAWTSTGVAPGTQLAGATPHYVSPM